MFVAPRWEAFGSHLRAQGFVQGKRDLPRFSKENQDELESKIA